MILPVSQLLATLPVAIVFLAVSFITGYFFQLAVNGKKKSILFFSPSSNFWFLFTGLWLIVSVYAIITTKFQTLLLPVPLLLFFLVRNSEMKISLGESIITSFSEKKTILLILSALIVYWLFYFSGYISLDQDLVRYLNIDRNFYGRIAMHMNSTGVENTSLEYLGLKQQTPEPYHYGDVWMIALVQRITGIHPSVITFLVVYPVMAVLFILGIINFLLSLFKNALQPFSIIIIILAGFFSGIVFLSPFFSEQGYTASKSIISNSKLFFPAFLIITILHAAVINKWFDLILFSIVGCLLYITIAPAVFIFVLLLILYLLVTKKTFIKKLITPLLLSAICLFNFYYLYQVLQSPDNNVMSVSSVPVRRYFNIIAGGFLHLFPLSPFILFYYLIVKNNSHQLYVNAVKIKRAILLMILFYFISLLCWSAFSSITFESFQLFTNIALPLSSIFIIITLIVASQSGHKKIKVITAFLCIISLSINIFFNSLSRIISKKNLAEVSEFINKDTNLFVSLKSRKELLSVFYSNTEYNIPLPYLDYTLPFYNNISLNTVSLLQNSPQNFRKDQKEILAATSYNRYANLHPQLIKESERMIQFIKDYHINYFCISPDTLLPLYIRPVVTDSITLENNWKIYRIVYNFNEESKK